MYLFFPALDPMSNRQCGPHGKKFGDPYQCAFLFLPFLYSPIKRILLQGHLLKACTKKKKVSFINLLPSQLNGHRFHLCFPLALLLFNNGKYEKKIRICSIKLYFTWSAVGRWDFKFFTVMYGLPSSLDSLYWWCSIIFENSLRDVWLY